MNFLHRSRSSYLRRSCRHHHHQHIRTLYDGVSTIICPRDRGLDHAVERERHLRPLLNLKNVIISEPSKSIPLPLITQSNETMGIPFRPIEFIRKYPSIFEEFHPGSLNIQPHIRLTPEVVSLSSEENLLYESVDYKQDIAGRLLKLLMIGRINKVPIFLLEQLKWELGLPQDFEKVLVPEFPDYFRVISGKNLGENGKELELVCWSDEFAVSELEKKRGKDGKIQFTLGYSNGFEMDKKYKKWVDEWQKLPYVSPYENAVHLAVKTDESDKWVVAVLHEVLNLFVGKKAEKETLLCLGDFFGLRSRFKRAFLQHPGIFYVSSKIGTHTVVLREGYKRGMLIERQSLMDMRFKYVKLMNVVKDEEKPKSTEPKAAVDVKGSEGEEMDGEDGEEDTDEDYESSEDDDDENDDYEKAWDGENVAKRGRFRGKEADFEEKNARRNVARRTNGRSTEENVYENSTRFSKRTNFRGGENVARRTNGRSTKENAYENSTRFSNRTDFRGDENVARRTNGRSKEENVYDSSSRFSKRNFFRGGENIARRTNGRSTEENVYDNSSRFSKRTNFRGGKNMGRRTNGRSTEENLHDNSSSFSKRNMARRSNGRSTEENAYDNSSRFSKRTNFCGGENVARRTNGSTDAYENSTRFSRRTNTHGGGSNIPRSFTQKLDFEEKNTRSAGRRTNGRSTKEDVYKSSSRFSRRTNVRGGDRNSLESPQRN